MHPILFVLELGDVSRPIGAYGALAALAIAIAGFGAVRASARAGVDVGLTFAGVALAILGGAAGAWLTFGAVEWARTGSPAGMWEGGGLVFLGSVPGAAVGLWLARAWLGLDVVRVVELSAPTTIAAHAVGRLGCFFGGCCYGRATDGPWAVVYEHAISGAEPIGRHPSPLYEATFLLALGLAFALRPPDRPGDGRRVALWLGIYCVGRAGLELLRGDLVRGLFGGLSTSQWLAGLGLGVAVLVWRRGGRLLQTG